ncbi:hypothetical protein [Pleomorphovibrio marinus]|uniref:hypothetical protein n=1 Tax=Pleomorphovibrio marinus TaxID=2164132 RepID=UPI000E0BB0E5|nr:hypothetical protein [Pleomorphovibrio marinus]
MKQQSSSPAYLKFLSSFSGKLLLFTGMISLLVVALQSFLKPGFIHNNIWLIILFYALLTLATGNISEKLLQNKKYNSVSVLMGGIVFRLLASLAFVFVVLKMGDENILWFVVNFFAVYLLYLLFDIYGLITNLRLHLK